MNLTVSVDRYQPLPEITPIKELGGVLPESFDEVIVGRAQRKRNTSQVDPAADTGFRVSVLLRNWGTKRSKHMPTGRTDAHKVVGSYIPPTGEAAGKAWSGMKD